MARSCVLSLSWPKRLIARFLQCVPPEARSAFVYRAVTREIAAKECVDLKEIEWTPTLIEAWARSWLMCAIIGASTDPRMRRLGYDGSELISIIRFDDLRRVGIDRADESLPPVVIGGREFVRRPRAIDRGENIQENIPGSDTFCVRWPTAGHERLLEAVPRDRSRFFAAGVGRELTIVEAVDARLKLAKDTMTVFDHGCVHGQEHGLDLLHGASLDSGHIENLVAREIAAYVLAAGIVGRR